MMTHRPGDVGDEVGLLQHCLAHAGFVAPVTHRYDEATKRAVSAFQASVGLVVDGVAGPNTLAALASAQRDPRQLGDADFLDAAASLGVDAASVRAVAMVESRGRGFLDDGRPSILFERHIFWQRLQAHGLDPAHYRPREPDIVTPTRGGYAGGPAEYARLQRAEAIHAGAAWESTSWGAFQIMGEHWQRLGYRSVAEFVSCMERSERDQLDAFVQFVRTDAHLIAALRARDWAAFARAYNGRAFHDNLYDTKLAQAYVQPASNDRTA